MSRISKSEPCHVHYAGWVKFLFEIYMNAWIYLSPRSPRASGRVSFPVVALLWNGVAWSLKAPHMRPPNKSAWCTSRTMDGGRGKGNDLASLLVGPEQSLQSGVPGWGFNRPSLCIRCASCDEPLKGGSSSGAQVLEGVRPLKKRLASQWLQWDCAAPLSLALVGWSKMCRAQGPAMWRGNSCRVTFGCTHTHIQGKVVWMCVRANSGVSCGWLAQIKVWVCVTDGSNNDQIALVMETAQFVMAS